MTNLTDFSSLPLLESEFAEVTHSGGDRKHEDAPITDATIQSLRSYVADLKKQLTERDRTIDKLREEVKVQETIIKDCLTELEARNVRDTKTVRRPQYDINAGPRPDVSPRNSVPDVPVSATRITHDPCGRVVTIALKNVSCMPRSSQ